VKPSSPILDSLTTYITYCLALIKKRYTKNNQFIHGRLLDNVDMYNITILLYGQSSRINYISKCKIFWDNSTKLSKINSLSFPSNSWSSTYMRHFSSILKFESNPKLEGPHEEYSAIYRSHRRIPNMLATTWSSTFIQRSDVLYRLAFESAKFWPDECQNSDSTGAIFTHDLYAKILTRWKILHISSVHHFFRKYIPSLSSNFSSATRPDKKLCSCWSDLS